MITIFETPRERSWIVYLPAADLPRLETMMHYQGNTQYVDKCREQGFVPLVWEENVVDKVTGITTDRSSLSGDRFRIDVILSPSFTKILERRERVGYADSTFTRVEIRFNYLTDIGPLSYSHVYEANPYERAKEYAQWQATAIFKFLSSVNGTEFVGELEDERER